MNTEQVVEATDEQAIGEMKPTIEVLIDELPPHDVLHCYDYEIRTNDLKALVRELSDVKAREEKMRVALESISGTISADYAIRRANEVLAEIGVEGY